MRHHAIMALYQYRGRRTRYWMNSGERVSPDAERAREEFNRFSKENPGVKAALIDVTEDGADGPVLASVGGGPKVIG